MTQILWDASALAKRYAIEMGSETTDALWASPSAKQMTFIFLGYAEVYSILLRKRNQNKLAAAAFAAAKSLLRDEIINSLDFTLLSMDAMDILAGIDLMERHNINSADAAILAVYLRHMRASRNACVLVAADRRLLRAAAVEGLKTLNPELIPPGDVPAFLTAI